MWRAKEAESRAYENTHSPLNTEPRSRPHLPRLCVIWNCLKPVTFRYKHELDPAGIPQFGLVAEDVEKVNPDLVARDADGKAYTVRYEAVNAMLLNEFLKEHRKNEKQEATIAELKSTVAQQQRGFDAKLAKQEEQIETLTAGLQKVSAQLELNRTAPQTALSNQ